MSFAGTHSSCPEPWHCFSVSSTAWKWNFWMFLLNKSEIQHFVLLCLSSEILHQFWSNVAKTVQRLQMDLENVRCVGSFSFKASALFSPAEHQGPVSRLHSQAVQEGRGFASRLGMRNTSQVSISLSVTLRSTRLLFRERHPALKGAKWNKERGTNELECSGVKKKKKR